MHLHRLTLCAIGPYAGEHRVDFDRLGESGLFLLEGPTGSGKSSVIDAVVFALYGRVAGEESSDDRMRSDFAAPSTTPFVELVFSTSAGLYCVRRTPKFERPKQRGSGTTTQHATATLWRLTSPDAPLGEPLTTRVDETSAQVRDVVGLSRDQFVQTMVLPQGEFASFLRAGAEERRGVLQRLFGTEVYDRVQRRLEDLRRQANSQRGEATARVREQVAAFTGATGLDAVSRDQLLAVVDDADELHRLVSGHASVSTDRAGALIRQAEADSAAARSLADELARAVERTGRAERKASLLAQRDQLQAGEPDVLAARDLLAAAERAERLRPLLEAFDRAVLEHERAEARCRERAAALSRALRSAGPAAWTTHADTLQARAAELAPHLDDELELARRQSEVDALHARTGEAREARDDACSAVAALPQRLRQARDEHAQVRQLVVTLPAARLARDAAAGRLTAARRAAALADRLAAAQEELAQATVAARLAAEREHELRTRWFDGMAGQLARSLVVGEPCTVCGSTAHPRPARAADDAVDRAAVDAAEAERNEAVTVHDVLAQGVTELRAQLQVAEAAAGGATEVAAAAARQEAEAQLARHEEAQQRDAQLQELLAHLQQQEQTLRDAAAAASAALERVMGEHEAAHRELDRAREGVVRWRGGHEDIASHLADLLAQLEPLQAVLDASRAAEQAATSVVRCRDDLARWSTEHGFDRPEAARAALLDQGARAPLGELVDQYDKATAAVAAGLADPALATVEPVTDHDLAPLQQHADEAAARAATALEGAATAQQTALAATSGAAAVQQSLQARAAELARTAPVVRLANLATASTADNARSMTLATYVLIERFRDVVAAANDRLSTMSEGRYVLQHVEDRSGQRRVGLDLAVRDHHTGQLRDPRTLSGGESFYCSLALALGLADVVSSEAGGITLGTLFVDEGFGSLDPDALEHVLEVLDRLRAGGRVVGVVSHVPELKDRISERIVVSRNADGSSRLAVVA